MPKFKLSDITLHEASAVGNPAQAPALIDAFKSTDELPPAMKTLVEKAVSEALSKEVNMPDEAKADDTKAEAPKEEAQAEVKSETKPAASAPAEAYKASDGQVYTDPQMIAMAKQVDGLKNEKRLNEEFSNVGQVGEKEAGKALVMHVLSTNPSDEVVEGLKAVQQALGATVGGNTGTSLKSANLRVVTAAEASGATDTQEEAQKAAAEYAKAHNVSPERARIEVLRQKAVGG